MNTHYVEYRAKRNTANNITTWNVITHYVPFKSLRLERFDIRINGEVFGKHEDSGFEEKYNNATIWLRLST